MKLSTRSILLFLLVMLIAILLAACHTPDEDLTTPDITTDAPTDTQPVTQPHTTAPAVTTTVTTATTTLTTEAAVGDAVPFTEEAVKVATRILTDDASYKTVPATTVIQTESDYQAYQKAYFLQCFFFEEVTGNYDQAFFEAHTLVILYRTLGTGMARSYTRSVTLAASTVTVTLGTHYPTMDVSDDMGYMLHLVSIPKTDASSVEVLYAEREILGWDPFYEKYPNPRTVGLQGSAIEADGQSDEPRRVTSREEFTRAISEMGYHDLPESLLAAYDDSFFSSHTLILLPITATQTTERYFGAGAVLTEDAIHIKLGCHNLENGTDGSSEWLLLLALSSADSTLSEKSLIIDIWQTEFLSPETYNARYPQ